MMIRSQTLTRVDRDVYAFAGAVIVVGIGGYLGAIFGTPDAYAPLWWLAAYAIFVGLNVWGVEMTFRVTVVVTRRPGYVVFEDEYQVVAEPFNSTITE